MKKTLYYTIEKEIYDDGESLNGNKTISVYEIIDNTPKPFCTIDTTLEENSIEVIQEYLDDNGFGDDDFNFIQL